MSKKKIIVGIVLSLISLVIIALALLPIIGKNYVINHSKELLGRQVQIDKLKLNYFTGTLKVLDFKMLEQNEQDIFCSFDTLIVDLEPYQLISDELVLEQFYLKGLNINAIKKDSAFNFDDLIAFHTSETDSISKDTPTEPLKYSLSNIEFKDVQFSFDDQNIDHITKIKELSFFVPFIGWDQNDKSEAGIKFNLAKGGYFESDLKIDAKSGEYEADLTLNSLYLEPFLKYIQEYAEINYINGQLNAHLLIHGNVNEITNSIVAGDLQLYDFEMNDKNDKQFLATTKINCVLKEINYANSSYIIDSLSINEPYVFFKLDSLSNNLSTTLKNTDKESTQVVDTTSKASEDTLYYAINHFNIKNGVTDYTDNLTGSPFDYYLSEITVNSDSILSNANWVNIYSNMLLNKRGTLKAKIGFNPLDFNNINSDISIEKFRLPDINIYADYYMGHNILEGDMYYYSNSKIVNGQITSENKLLIKNPTLSSTKKGLYSLPLKFALFILTDKNGEVNLDIPVRGNLNDPSVDVKKIVWHTFKNLIIKTAASPGKLLAGLVGGNAEDLETIQFNYLDSIPSEKNKKQLNMLLKLEEKKEDLAIELEYFVDPDLQKTAIAKAIVGKLYLKKTKKDYVTDEVGFKSFVMKKIKPDTLILDKAYMAIATQKKVDSIANFNNKLLLNNLQNYLKTTQDSTQIKIEISNPEAPENIGSKPFLKVNFTMKDDNK